MNTHYAEGTLPFTLVHVVFAATAPWTAGVSLQDLLRWLFLNPSRPIFSDDTPIIILFMLPVACLAAALIARNGWKRVVDRDFKVFTIVFTAFFCAAMMFLYLRHSPLPLDERHFRPAGILILIWMMAICLKPDAWQPARYAVLTFCGFLCLYGIVSFVQRAANARAEEVDTYSRTRQLIVDRQSIEMLQRAYAKWGHDALFVLPSADITVTLPVGARIINTAVDFASESQLAAIRYAGRVKGPIYVMIQTSLVATRKRELLMRSFAGYDPTAWQIRTFPKTTVFVQDGKP